MKLDRISFNFNITVRLYFNSKSHNRSLDSTPRFYLKPQKLNNVERVGFTKESAKHGYKKRGYRLWGYKTDWTLSDAQIEHIYNDDIKLNYPYGYDANDTASSLKYEFDVKQNETFQTFYSRYWSKHPEKIVDKTQDKTTLLPYIEFDTNELVNVKFTKDVPALQEEVPTWAEYAGDVAYYQEPSTYGCDGKDVNVYVSADGAPVHFTIDGNSKYPMTVFSSGGSYNFHLKNGSVGTRSEGKTLWPTGSAGEYSGYKFAFSTGVDGTHNGHNEYTTDVVRWVSPEVINESIWYVAVGTKDLGHSFYGQGASNGFLLNEDREFLTENGKNHGLGRNEIYQFNTSTSAGNPGNGKIVFRGSNILDVEDIEISTHNKAIADVSSWLNEFDDQKVNGGTFGGYLRMTSSATPANYVLFLIDGTTTNSANHKSLQVGWIESNGTFSNDEDIIVEFSPKMAPDLHLVRGNTYKICQTGESNVGHPMYISTSAIGGGADTFSSGVVRWTGVAGSPVSGEGYLHFTVPYEAPDLLYYGCANHSYMGGDVNISNPVSALGNKPGETVRITFNNAVDEAWNYYSPVTGKMGSFMFLKKDCSQEQINL
jgi:hypothetical protein